MSSLPMHAARPAPEAAAVLHASLFSSLPVQAVCGLWRHALLLQGLDEHVDKVEVITQLVTDGQENLAQQWVATLGKDYQVSSRH